VDGLQSPAFGHDGPIGGDPLDETDTRVPTGTPPYGSVSSPLSSCGSGTRPWAPADCGSFQCAAVRSMHSTVRDAVRPLENLAARQPVLVARV